MSKKDYTIEYAIDHEMMSLEGIVKYSLDRFPAGRVMREIKEEILKDAKMIVCDYNVNRMKIKNIITQEPKND